jgi:hypothetical protein
MKNNIMELLSSLDVCLNQARKILDVIKDSESDLIKIREKVKECEEVNKIVNKKKEDIIEVLSSLVLLTKKNEYFLSSGGYHVRINKPGEFYLYGARGTQVKENGLYSSQKFIEWLSSINFAYFCNDMLINIEKYINNHSNRESEISRIDLFLKRLFELSTKV